MGSLFYDKGTFLLHCGGMFSVRVEVSLQRAR